MRETAVLFPLAGRCVFVAGDCDIPAEFLYDKLGMAANVIKGLRRSGVKKLLFLGSSCINPRLGGSHTGSGLVVRVARVDPVDEAVH